MRSLPTGFTGSERMTSASFMLASNGLEGGTRPNGCPRIPGVVCVCVCVVCVRESMCVCVVVVGEHSMLLHYYNYQGLTLHIKWSINGGWEICDVRIRLIIHSFVFSQHCQWTPFYKPKHRSMVRRYNLS